MRFAAPRETAIAICRRAAFDRSPAFHGRERMHSFRSYQCDGLSQLSGLYSQLRECLFVFQKRNMMVQSIQMCHSGHIHFPKPSAR
ncbi:MAG: hypothetical protein DWI00_05420 [Planctomycetota bacterium]|nr:MAG: hypothetical protein DWI00_05420 [Planctomycetota bacterium]